MTFTEMLRGWCRDMPAGALWLFAVCVVVQALLAAVAIVAMVVGWLV